MKLNDFIECIERRPTLKITVNHPLIDKFISEDRLVSKECREKFKTELDEGLNLDDFLGVIAYNFLPKDLVKIFSEGAFYLK